MVKVTMSSAGYLMVLVGKYHMRYEICSISVHTASFSAAATHLLSILTTMLRVVNMQDLAILRHPTRWLAQALPGMDSSLTTWLLVVNMEHHLLQVIWRLRHTLKLRVSMQDTDRCRTTLQHYSSKNLALLMVRVIKKNLRNSMSTPLYQRINLEILAKNAKQTEVKVAAARRARSQAVAPKKLERTLEEMIAKGVVVEQAVVVAAEGPVTKRQDHNWDFYSKTQAVGLSLLELLSLLFCFSCGIMYEY